MNTLLSFLVSLCVTELIHNSIEIWGMRQKVKWLRLSLYNKKHGRWPVNIDTKLKTVILHVVILVSVTGLSYLILKALNLSTENLVLSGIIIFLISYMFTTWKVDAFHTEIGKLIKKAKK